MLVYEISKNAVKICGSVEKAIAAGAYNTWTRDRVKLAFNFGRGTEKDFERYMQDNKQFCYFINKGVKTC